MSERLNLFSDLVHAALLDGELHDEDQRRLDRYGEEMGLSAIDRADVFEFVLSGFKRNLHRPENKADRRQMFERFIELALVDGKLEVKEQKFLNRLAGHYGITPQEVGRLVRQAQSEKSG